MKKRQAVSGKKQIVDALRAGNFKLAAYWLGQLAVSVGAREPLSRLKSLLESGQYADIPVLARTLGGEDERFVPVMYELRDALVKTGAYWPVLSICILASDRPADQTRRCLASLDNLRKSVDCEVVIADTGASRETRSVVDAYADRVIDFTWINDFSAARNACLDESKGLWYMALDDDEWFEDTEDIERFFLSLEYRNFDTASYPVHSYCDEAGTNYTLSYACRLFDTLIGTRWLCRVHETLEPMYPNDRRLTSFTHHYGYLHESLEDFNRHLERNVKLLEADIADGELPHRLLFHRLLQLAAEYAQVERYDRVADSLVRARDIETSAECLNAAYGLIPQALLAVVYMKMNNYGQAIQTGEEYLGGESSPLNETRVRYALCIAYYETGEDWLSVQNALRYAQLYRRYLDNPEVYREETQYYPRCTCLDAQSAGNMLINAVCAAFHIGDPAHAAELLVLIPYGDETLNRSVKSFADVLADGDAITALTLSHELSGYPQMEKILRSFARFIKGLAL